MRTSVFRLLVFVFTLYCSAIAAHAQSRCLAVANAPWQKLIQKASLKKSEVRLTFIGHSTFLIESPKGIRIATDYNDYVKPRILPDVITMNQAHDTHYTDNVDKRIRHVLRGWNTTRGAALHNIKVADVRIRNVPTNTRTWNDGTMLYGNSIFVFEVSGLCIAHLGHLHHTLTTQQLAQIGQMDVVLVPVDGSFTLDIPTMMKVLKSLSARVVVPMHYFSSWGLNRFLKEARAGNFDIVTNPVSTVVLSQATMPSKPRILVLPEP